MPNVPQGVPTVCRVSPILIPITLTFMSYSLPAQSPYSLTLGWWANWECMDFLNWIYPKICPNGPIKKKTSCEFWMHSQLVNRNHTCFIWSLTLGQFCDFVVLVEFFRLELGPLTTLSLDVTFPYHSPLKICGLKSWSLIRLSRWWNPAKLYKMEAPKKGREKETRGKHKSSGKQTTQKRRATRRKWNH